MEEKIITIKDHNDINVNNGDRAADRVEDEDEMFGIHKVNKLN